MKDRYEALVVGSGFAGAVAACRLAQAGVDVAILERGRRFAGDFPRPKWARWGCARVSACGVAPWVARCVEFVRGW